MSQSPTPLRLFNSLTRQIEDFEPVHAGEARVYTCGPTVYNYPHIGNMRAYVFADTLGRVLSYKGYKLTHVINITDVGHLTDDADAGEDKMEKMAAEKAQSIWDIAKHYTEAYWTDVKALNIRGPMKNGAADETNWSIATKFIDQMIAFAESITDKHCYELESGLYFDTSTVADYGNLAPSHGSQSESRILPVPGKRNEADFAIWRKSSPSENRQMEWPSPWGMGAPGWHLECSVMSEALLELPFDIHTGGIDHREIHHPNEIAQNQAFKHSGGLDCAENSGARVWMHNNFLIDRTGKMSKSSGEFLRVQLLIDKGFHPLAFRLMCLQGHYRSELEFSWEGLQAALTRLKRMMKVIQIRLWEEYQKTNLDVDNPNSFHPIPYTNPSDGFGYLMDFREAIYDDLNTPKCIPLLEDVLHERGIDNPLRWELVATMDQMLGLNLLELDRKDLRIRPKAAVITVAEIEAALDERKAARAAKDFAKSDAIRDDLIAKGVEVMDGDPLGWDWRIEI